MPLYSVVTRNRIIVESFHTVEAENEKDAIALIKSGEMAYSDFDYKETQDGDEEIVSINKIEA